MPKLSALHNFGEIIFVYAITEKTPKDFQALFVTGKNPEVKLFRYVKAAIPLQQPGCGQKN